MSSEQKNTNNIESSTTSSTVSPDQPQKESLIDSNTNTTAAMSAVTTMITVTIKSVVTTMSVITTKTMSTTTKISKVTIRSI